MKRLLCIVGSMNVGGAETFLMKIYRKLDRSQYQMDFCVTEEKNFYGEEIKNMGGHIYFVPPKSKNPFKTFFAIKKIVKENKIQQVLRVNEHSLSTLDLLAAKWGGAKRLIMRSSNASSPSRASRFLHRLFQFLPKKIPTVKISPSTEAAIYTFGKKMVKNGHVQFLHNGIDLNVFHFEKPIREAYRKNLNLDGKFVVGHIGRFSTQKNHNFLLEIFSELKKENPLAVLLLVGKGELEVNIREKATQMGLLESIIFLGLRSDIPQILSAMDIFVFPSLYEGMPNTVIEAQAMGLPCIISDTITHEANITQRVKYLPIENAKEWAKTILEQDEMDRENVKLHFIEHKYDIDSVVEEFTRQCFKEEST